MSSFSGSQPSRRSNEFKESVATIEAALDDGINFINTGDFYGQGHNESVVARAIEHRRDQAFLSVKFGVLRGTSGSFLGLDVRPNSVKNFAAYSLQRLDVDVIDLYQPGRIDPTVPIEDTVGAIADLIQEGKVRYLGLSEVNAQQLRRAHSVYPVTALEIEYSLATRMIEPEILPTARELGISIVAYNVLGQGLLTGAVDADLSEGDSRANLPRFQKENLARNLKAVSVLDSIAAAKGCTPAQLAIAWTLSRGEDIVALLGMSHRSRLPENLAALDIVVSANEANELDRAFAPGAIVGHRGPSHVKHLSPQWWEAWRSVRKRLSPIAVKAQEDSLSGCLVVQGRVSWPCAKTKLGIPDLEHSKAAVLRSLASPDSRRGYQHAIDEFVAWYCSEPRLAFNKTVVLRYRFYLEERGLAPGTINVRMAAVRRLAYEAADSGLLSPELAAGIHRVKGIRKLGSRLGNWLTANEALAFWQSPDCRTLTGKRNRSMLAISLGCGLRRRELSELTFDSLQRREERWAIVDLVGKGRHIRTVPVPNWVKETLDAWLEAAGISNGPLFRCVCRAGKLWGYGISEKTVWHVVKKAAMSLDIPRLAPHDLRRSCARLCHHAGGELEQIQFLLGLVSVQTTERYIGCKQHLRIAVNDRLGIEPG